MSASSVTGSESDNASPDQRITQPTSVMTDDDLLEQAKAEHARHWEAHRRPISVDTWQ
ncbi:hypothetical protein [Actinocrispum wychmicini]|uniref:hypothetical protein n=1 Tax=Actinocrispum wychmicini TaxID=1213861 RepID=UPI001404CC61|nr:hypothetical protein [Actinocrispum wychmicini]